MTHTDPRLSTAQVMLIADVAARLGLEGLRRIAGELVGPCPECGGKDRFAINLRKQVYNCRNCGGGDGIALVQLARRCDFAEALDFLTGEARQVDPRIIEERRRKAEAERRRQDAYAERARQEARADAIRIWQRAKGQNVAPVLAYLEKRGIRLPSLPISIRFLPDHPYRKRVGGRTETLHIGPAMIAAIQGADGKLSAVHQTWIDLSRPNGKAIIRHGAETLPAKLVRGSKKGGAIRLCAPADADTLVMGEGLETTGTAWVAGAVPGAAYWAGVDLGNMAGRMLKVEGVRHSGRPDLADPDAFIPPPWVKRLIFIQDGDSEAKMTRAKLECGLRRAMAARPGLIGQIVNAGEGVDLNDVLMGKSGKEPPQDG